MAFIKILYKIFSFSLFENSLKTVCQQVHSSWCHKLRHIKHTQSLHQKLLAITKLLTIYKIFFTWCVVEDKIEICIPLWSGRSYSFSKILLILVLHDKVHIKGDFHLHLCWKKKHKKPPKFDHMGLIYSTKETNATPDICFPSSPQDTRLWYYLLPNIHSSFYCILFLPVKFSTSHRDTCTK